tara:strand:+ start:125172 stop:127331 length:2160 start_codon:yes stop_codon:yes gene_type:complete
MPTKLDIESLELKNFLSYGDYTTKLDIKKNGAGLGPVLILGEVDLGEKSASNGAGKSSLITAFIWCLFGRTITNPSPGDKVINYFTDKDCYVKIKTTDGYEIVRTRNIDGHSELILKKDGDATGTHSTTKNVQEEINKLFGLDYEIFISSVFCGQLGKSFLEMSVVKRKEALERILGLNKLNQYADSAKLKLKEIEGEQAAVRIQISHSEIGIKSSEASVCDLEDSSQQHAAKKQEKLKQIEEAIEYYEDMLYKMEVPPELPVIEHKWITVQAIRSKLEDYHNKIESNLRAIRFLKKAIETDEKRLNDEPLDEPDLGRIRADEQECEVTLAAREDKQETISALKQKRQTLIEGCERLQSTILEWESKGDSKCTSCDQIVSQDHVFSKIGDHKDKIGQYEQYRDKLTGDLEKHAGWLTKNVAVRPSTTVEQAERIIKLNLRLKNDQARLQGSIDDKKIEIDDLLEENEKKKAIIKSIKAKLDDVIPEITTNEARDLNRKFDSCGQKIEEHKQKLEEVREEPNPYVDVIQKVEGQLKARIDEHTKLEESISHLDILFAHYNYVYRSYSDRRKIKKWLLSELIPYLNSRIHYYLESFDININIAFTSTLTVETDKWGYDFCSGGERKRIDLSIMFALYDLYMSIYGQQCNIMILDEVDGRLDQKGVQAFADLVNDMNTDNSDRPCPDTIFVISHKGELRNVFPTQLMIKKQNEFSTIDESGC